MIIYIRIWIRYIFVRNYDFIYMIMDNLTMSWLWYPANEGYSLVLWYTANGGYSLVFWYPDQRGLFIGTLIPKSMGVVISILIPKPIGFVHWYSDT